MPRAIFIKGCGLMACFSYTEVAAAMDSAYAVPSSQPLPMAEVLASPTPETGRDGPARQDSPPAPEPG